MLQPPGADALLARKKPDDDPHRCATPRGSRSRRIRLLFTLLPSLLLHHSRPKAHGFNQGLAFRSLEILTRRTFVLWVVDSLRTRPTYILCKNVSIGSANSIFRWDCRDERAQPKRSVGCTWK